MRGAATAKKKRTAGRPKLKAGDRRPRRAGLDIAAVYRKLFAANGQQHWWPGDSAFEIMVGAVLTQNTAWTNVERAIGNLKQAKALSPAAIAKAQPRRLAAWLRPSGYFNVKARRLQAMCRWLIESGGVIKLKKIPTGELRQALLAVHGIGPETADDILLYAFQRPVFVIDAYTRRIFSRLGVIRGNEHYETLRHLFENALGPNVQVFNEYHALIVAHGKNVCRKRPVCGGCPLVDDCPDSSLFMTAVN
jgi:endonuclease III related protein